MVAEGDVIPLGAAHSGPLRLAVLSTRGWCYRVVESWAASQGHEIILRVPSGDGQVVSSQEALAADLVRVAPDLIIIFWFGRVATALARSATYGMVNVHPALLPSYSGPNAFRSLYDGSTQLSGTVHWATDVLDGGNVLAASSIDRPTYVDVPRVLRSWSLAIIAALEVGVARAVAGDRGEEQLDARRTYARLFVKEEAYVDANAVGHELAFCRVTALFLYGMSPTLRFDGTEGPVLGVKVDPDVELSEVPRRVSFERGILSAHA
jgi:hypothetical protein